MTKTAFAVLVSVLAVIIIGAAVVANNQKDDKATVPEATSTTSQTEGTTTQENQTAQPNQPASQIDKVDIKNFAFSPEKITVKKGTTVTWTNQDTIKHDVTPDNPSADFKASELLAKGESYSFTFNTVGTFSYHCSPHPQMKATVEVTE